MKAIIRNAFDMAKSVVTYCQNNLTTLGVIPALLLVYNQFKGIVDAMEVVIQDQIALIKGITEAKQQSRVLLEKYINKVAKALRAYANHINDLELKKDVHFSKSKLKAVSATMLKGIAANVLAKASAPGIDLTDYGVDATVLADFAAAKADFILKCNTPREAIAIRKTNTRKLNLLKKQMMDLLKDEVDLLVDVLPDLYDDFKETFSNTRIIIDRKGKRLKRKPEEGYGVIYGNVYNAAGEPVEDAIVTVKESGKELTTDEEGAFYDEKEKVGIYTLEVVALTYKKKIVPNVEVVANDEMTIDIVLELDEIV